MRPVTRWFKMLSMLSIIVIAGCFSAREPESPVNVSGLNGTPGQADIEATLDWQGPSESSSPSLSEVKKPKKDLQISSPETIDATDSKGETEETIEAQQAGAPQPNYDVEESYNAAKPTLMGFSVGDAMSAVISRFGKPLGESVMQDGDTTLIVYEYPGFMFGADRQQSIVFIEVNSDRINPGLNQVRIGSTAEEAVKALGEPSTLNEFVLVYGSGGVVLKCDLDPATSVIRSIKLFAEEG